MNRILEVKHLNKSFDGNNVLSDITIDIYRGEFVCIMGQSGSGKSTLLYAMSGMDRPDLGSVYFMEKDIALMNDEQISAMRLKRMGFVFQNAHLLKTLSVRDNIMLPGLRAKKMSRKALNVHADTLIDKTGLESVQSSDTKKISGGQLQRAAVCRALINQPDIIFGDEPTGALNTKATCDVLDIFNQAHDQGTTIVIVTHDAKVAARAERVIYLRDGKVLSALSLGRYKDNKKEQQSREKELKSWLAAQGF